MSVYDRIAKLGLEVPPTPKPAGAYVPAVIAGKLAFSSGQTNTVDGVPTVKGKVGREVTLEEAYQVARVAVLKCLACLESALGSLDRIERIVKVTGYVASAEGFGEQPRVINGASELLLEIFGERGQHARAALGVAELPFGAPVEVELIVEIAD